MAIGHSNSNAPALLEFIKKNYPICCESQHDCKQPLSEPHIEQSGPQPVVPVVAAIADKSSIQPIQAKEAQPPQKIFATVAAATKIVDRAQENTQTEQPTKLKEKEHEQPQPAIEPQGSCTSSTESQTQADAPASDHLDAKTDEKQEPKKAKPPKKSQPQQTKSQTQPKTTFQFTEDISTNLEVKQLSATAAATHNQPHCKKPEPKLSRSEKQAIAEFKKEHQKEKQKSKKALEVSRKKKPPKKKNRQLNQKKKRKRKKRLKQQQKRRPMGSLMMITKKHTVL